MGESLEVSLEDWPDGRLRGQCEHLNRKKKDYRRTEIDKVYCIMYSYCISFIVESLWGHSANMVMMSSRILLFVCK